MIDNSKNNLIRMKSYSLGNYLLSIFLIILFSIACFIILGVKSDPLSSFITSSLAFLFITIFSTLILLKNRKWLWFFLLAYLIKLIIGLCHYLYFIDPNYFQTGVYKPLTWEFEAVFNQISSIAIEKREYGLLYFNYKEGDVNHQELLSIISIPFIYFGNHVLTITSINTFSSLLLSINILLISKYRFNLSNQNLKYVAITTAYFPMTLIPSLLYRDIVGLSIISIGLVVILFSRKKLITYFMLIIACYLFYLQRTIYPVILLMAFIINSVFFQSYQRGTNLFYKIATILVSIIVLPIIVTYSNTEANENMASEAFSFNFLFLPVKIILGLIGPFPWNQFLTYNDIPANAYQLQDYLQGTFNVTIVVLLILFRKKYFIKNRFNLMNLTGILLILSGVFNTFMHMTYVAVGFIFLVPWILSVVSFKKFRQIYVYVFLTILFLNIIIFAFFGNLGLKSLL